jgi:hypothetical protein
MISKLVKTIFVVDRNYRIFFVFSIILMVAFAI